MTASHSVTWCWTYALQYVLWFYKTKDIKSHFSHCIPLSRESSPYTRPWDNLSTTFNEFSLYLIKVQVRLSFKEPYNKLELISATRMVFSLLSTYLNIFSIEQLFLLSPIWANHTKRASLIVLIMPVPDCVIWMPDKNSTTSEFRYALMQRIKAFVSLPYVGNWPKGPAHKHDGRLLRLTFETNTVCTWPLACHASQGAAG